MSVSIHLSFDGQCEAAFRFYEQCFSAKVITMIKWSESPVADQAPPGGGNRILHATLQAGDAHVFGADSAPGNYEKPQGFSVLFDVRDTAEAERIFGKLAEGGTITMPLQETFWARSYGVVTDRFGIPWEINCSKAH
jgi:PhnB protein